MSIILQTFPDQAREASERALWPTHGLAPGAGGSAIPVQRAVVGLRLPHLPDFLTDQTLVGDGNAERLAEPLERQAQWVTNLWKWQSAAFSLRYIYRPERAGIEIALLARILARPEAAQTAAEQLLADLARLAQSFGLPVKEVATLPDLTALRTPLAAVHRRGPATRGGGELLLGAGRGLRGLSLLAAGRRVPPAVRGAAAPRSAVRHQPAPGPPVLGKPSTERWRPRPRPVRPRPIGSATRTAWNTAVAGPTRRPPRWLAPTLVSFAG
ncbi:MAG: hypothetical protein HZY76_00255 [Anaerolineae bacterium]|nr:MAG: hypothetical protein HZY76_00255 [Anaerolineae bacterium]